MALKSVGVSVLVPVTRLLGPPAWMSSVSIGEMEVFELTSVDPG